MLQTLTFNRAHWKMSETKFNSLKRHLHTHTGFGRRFHAYAGVNQRNFISEHNMENYKLTM